MTEFYQFSFTHEIFSEKVIESALKLQELVKERVKGQIKSGHKKFCDETGYLEQELYSLIEESEKS